MDIRAAHADSVARLPVASTAVVASTGAAGLAAASMVAEVVVSMVVAAASTVVAADTDKAESFNLKNEKPVCGSQAGFLYMRVGNVFDLH